MKRFLVTLAAMLALTPLARAQETRFQLQSYNNGYINANGHGAITGAIANSMNNLIITSSGMLVDANGWTGANTFTINPKFIGCVGYPLSTGSAAFTCSATIPSAGLAPGAAAANVGTLGGDLTGTLPSPTVAAGVITPTKMAVGAAATNLGYPSFSASGSTQKFATVSGTLTSSHCLRINATSDMIDSGFSCGVGVAEGRTLGLLGDSIVANYGTSQTQTCTSAACDWFSDKNIVHFTQLYSNSRLTLPSIYQTTGKYSNCGVAGTFTADMLANLPCIYNSHPDVVLVEGGTNDIAADLTCSAIVANLQAIYTQLNANGISVLRATIIPRASPAAFTTNESNTAQCVNMFDRSYAQITNSSHFTLIDLDRTVIDYSQTTWTIKSGYLSADGIHPSKVGGSAIGSAIAAFINQLVPDWRNQNIGISDVYDATYNPNGNLLPNGGMDGSAGGKTTCTGTVVGSNSSGSLVGVTGTPGTCVASIGSNANGEQTQIITISGSSTGTANVFYRQVVTTPANVNVNDVLEGLAVVSLGANTNISGLSLVCTSTENSVADVFSSSNPSQAVGDAMPAAGYAQTPVLLITPKHVAQFVPTQIFCDVRIYMQITSAVSGVVTISGMRLRKVS